MQDVKAAFGLTLPTDPDAAKAGKLLLTDYEVQNLRTAYDRTLEVGSASQKDMTQQDYELYGTYIPFSMAICHTINHKSGMDHTTYAHTGAMVNLYAMGVGAESSAVCTTTPRSTTSWLSLPGCSKTAPAWPGPEKAPFRKTRNGALRFSGKVLRTPRRGP